MGLKLRLSLLVYLLFLREGLFGVRLVIPGTGVDLLAQKLPVPFVGCNHGHDLTRSRPDAGQADITVDPFQGEDVGVTDTAYDLHGVVDNLLAGFGNELLGFGDSTADPVHVLPRYPPPGPSCKPWTGRVEEHDHLGYLEAHLLEGGDDLAEGFTSGGGPI